MKTKKNIFKTFGSSPKALANTTPTSRSKTGVRGVYLTGGNPKKGRFYFPGTCHRTRNAQRNRCL